MSKKLLSIFLIVLTLLLLTFPALAELSDFPPLGNMIVVNCDEWVSLRAAPSTSADRVIAVPLGATVAAYDANDGRFYYCEFEGVSGYILSEYLRAVGQAGPYAEAWANAIGDNMILPFIGSMDAQHARVDMSFIQSHGVSIGSYGQWILEYAKYEQTDAGFFNALADDAVGTASNAPDVTERGGDIQLIASELYAWDGIGSTVEFYAFTVDGRQGIFMCWAEPDGGEYSEYASIG